MGLDDLGVGAVVGDGSAPFASSCSAAPSGAVVRQPSVPLADLQPVAHRPVACAGAPFDDDGRRRGARGDLARTAQRHPLLGCLAPLAAASPVKEASGRSRKIEAWGVAQPARPRTAQECERNCAVLTVRFSGGSISVLGFSDLSGGEISETTQLASSGIRVALRSKA